MTMLLDRASIAGFGILLMSTAAQAQAPAEQFRDETSVTIVEVPVEVTVAGKPVDGLRADQFEVFVDGDRVAVQSFERVDVQAPESSAEAKAPRTTLPAAGRRRLLFLFDLSAGSAGKVARAQAAATSILDRLAPSDLVAVGTFSRLQGLDLLLHYSPDRAQVRSAMEQIGAGRPVRPRDPLKLAINVDEAVSRVALDMPGTRALLADPAAPDQALMAEKAARTEEQGDAVMFLRHLGKVAELCRSVEGRKHVVLFAEGFDEQLMGGTTDVEERLAMQRQVSEGGEIWRVDSDHYFGSQRVNGAIDKVTEALRRADCSLHTVDLAGLRSDASVDGGAARGSGGLFALADGTGGSYFENFNQLDQAVGTLLDRTRVAYLLAFQAENLESDGKFHKIRVTSRGLPAKAEVRHRPGFFAPDAKRGLSNFEQALKMGARLFDDRRPGELGLRAAAFGLEPPAEDGRAAVPLMVEIDPFTATPGAAPIDVLIYAFDHDGGVRDVVAQRFAWDAAAGQRGLKAMVPLMLPAGRHSIRVLAREPLTGATGLAVAQVEVPGKEPDRLLAVLVPSSFEGWQLARAQRKDVPMPTSHPFVFAETFYAPALTPNVAAPGSLPILLLGGDLGRVELLDGQGRLQGELTLASRRQERSLQGYGRFLREIALPALAPGDYSLALGDRRLPFRVVASGDASATSLAFLR